MNGKLYIKDKAITITVFFVVLLFFILFGKAFKVPAPFLIFAVFLMLAAVLLIFIMDYYKKRHFYQDFLRKLEQLNEKYLITELLEEPAFLEGNILLNSLYEINKSMKEKINDMEASVTEFRDFLELWVHEIKLPLSALLLMNYNESMDFKKEKIQLQKMNHYVEQILFYARSDTPQKDYLMKKCSLEAVVNKILISQKELLIGNHMRIEKKNLDTTVITDTKWLEFMLGQIINNSVKYKKGDSGKLVFDSHLEQDRMVLTVTDYGIGIPAADACRVFDKSFTGENGRKTEQSTGMGLYICKKLCDKLGHKIRIESEEGVYTKVCIAFGNDLFYEGVR